MCYPESMDKHTYVMLTEGQRLELAQMIRKGNLPACTNTRACILLLCDRSQGQRRTNREIAQAVLCVGDGQI